MRKLSRRAACALALLLGVVALLPTACAPQVAPAAVEPTRSVPTHQPAPSPVPTVRAVPTQAGAVSPLPTPGAAASPLVPSVGLPVDPGEALAAVLAAPDSYVGQKVSVAGTLDSKGSMSDVRFYLEGTDGRGLEVTPWLPIEVIQSPQGGQGPESMANYIGRQMVLTGTLEKGVQGPILAVSQAAAR